MPERPRAEYFLDGGYAASPAQTGIDDHQVRVLADGGNHRLGLTGRCCAHVVPHACEQLGEQHGNQASSSTTSTRSAFINS
jgi:hypothetical protein